MQIPVDHFIRVIPVHMVRFELDPIDTLSVLYIPSERLRLTDIIFYVVQIKKQLEFKWNGAPNVENRIALWLRPAPSLPSG